MGKSHKINQGTQIRLITKTQRRKRPLDMLRRMIERREREGEREKER